jgi:hypothetical protein
MSNSSQLHSVPRGAVLSNWAESDWTDECLRIDHLRELTTLAVQTGQSLYEITILNGSSGEVLVRGGHFFPDRVPAILNGSSFGGTIIKGRSICIGMRLEFVPQPAEMVSEVVWDECTRRNEIHVGFKVVRTSLVQSVQVISEPLVKWPSQDFRSEEM